jgi:hypothetical protein
MGERERERKIVSKNHNLMRVEGEEGEEKKRRVSSRAF